MFEKSEPRTKPQSPPKPQVVDKYTKKQIAWKIEQFVNRNKTESNTKRPQNQRTFNAHVLIKDDKIKVNEQVLLPWQFKMGSESPPKKHDHSDLRPQRRFQIVGG